jgi:hypothetical protein
MPKTAGGKTGPNSLKAGPAWLNCNDNEANIIKIKLTLGRFLFGKLM